MILILSRLGIHSSTAFSRLQRHGKELGTFNEIPTARFTFEPELKELTVIMTDDQTYTISPKDYEQISTLTKGSYIVTQCQDNTICDMHITEEVLNGHINDAIQVMNNAINRYNSQISTSWKAGRRLDVLLRRNGDPVVFRDEKPAVRLTRVQAMLNGHVLAVAYKLQGRNVPKLEAMRYMARTNDRVKTLFNHICNTAGEKNVGHYELHITRIHQLLENDSKQQKAERQRAGLQDSPIAQTLSVDEFDGSATKTWFEYWVKVVDDPRLPHEVLQIQAKAAFVSSVEWKQAGHQAEVRL